jgi:hypothetical protein
MCYLLGLVCNENRPKKLAHEFGEAPGNPFSTKTLLESRDTGTTTSSRVPVLRVRLHYQINATIVSNFFIVHERT